MDFERAKQIFDEVVARPETDREAFLAGLPDPPEIVAFVRELLQADQGTSTEARHPDPSPAGTGAPSRTNDNSWIGPYRVIRKIADGGMGSVFLARRDDKQFSRIVAIKVIRDEWAPRDIVDKFHNERKLLYSLDHKGIARILDGGATESGLPYLVMAYIDGQPIDRFCQFNKLSVQERIELFLQLCDAVSFCHTNLIVHRDLKPLNVLVTRDAEVKLLDFGIAKLLNPDLSPCPDATRPDLRIISLPYASPEQITGDLITVRADVYSLGVMLFALLTGRPPFDTISSSRKEIEAQIVEIDPPRPSTTTLDAAVEYDDRTASSRQVEAKELARRLNTDPERLQRTLVGDLDDIILVAMAKSPTHRYKNVEELAEDLRRYLDRRPVRARAMRRSVNWRRYQAERFVRRHRVSIATGITALVTLVIGLVFVSWQWHVAEQQRNRADKNFDVISDITKDLLFTTADEISTLPGSLSARAAVAERAADYLDFLDRNTTHDEGRLLAANGFDRLGELTGGVRSDNLGRTDKASEYFDRAANIRNSIPTDDAPAPIAVGLASSDLHRADVLFRSGQYAESKSAYQQGLDRLASEAVDPPTLLTARLYDGLANSSYRIDRTQIDTCRRLLQEAKTLLESDRTTSRDKLADVLYTLGVWANTASDHQAALGYFEDSLSIYENLLRARPAHADAIRGSAACRLAIGGFLQGTDSAAALDEWERAVVDLRFVLRAEREDNDARYLLFRLLDSIGSLKLRQTKDTLPNEINEAIAIARELNSAGGSRRQLQTHLSSIYHKRARHRRDSGDYLGATSDFLDMAVLSRALVVARHSPGEDLHNAKDIVLNATWCYHQFVRANRSRSEMALRARLIGEHEALISLISTNEWLLSIAEDGSLLSDLQKSLNRIPPLEQRK